MGLDTVIDLAGEAHERTPRTYLLCIDTSGVSASVRGCQDVRPLLVYVARETGGRYVRVRNDVGHWRRYLRRRFVEIVLPPVASEAFDASWQKKFDSSPEVV